MLLQTEFIQLKRVNSIEARTLQPNNTLDRKSERKRTQKHWLQWTIKRCAHIMQEPNEFVISIRKEHKRPTARPVAADCPLIMASNWIVRWRCEKCVAWLRLMWLSHSIREWRADTPNRSQRQYTHKIPSKTSRIAAHYSCKINFPRLFNEILMMLFAVLMGFCSCSAHTHSERHLLARCVEHTRFLAQLLHVASAEQNQKYTRRAAEENGKQLIPMVNDALQLLYKPHQTCLLRAH